MTRNIDKFVLFLAASDLTEKELLTVTDWIDAYGARSMLAAVAHLRREAAGAIAKQRASLATRTEQEASAGRSAADATGSRIEVTSTVERLLKREAGLPFARAAEMLVPEVAAKTGLPRSVLSPRPGDGYRTWIRRLLRQVPASALLHEATRIRNRIMHEPPPDWPLRERYPQPDDVAGGVERLVKERGMSPVAYAKDLLASALRARLRRALPIHPRQNEGLRRWVERILEVVPPSIVWDAALSIVGLI